MKIDLILPTFNNSNLTIMCLDSINNYYNKNDNIDINVIWVDVSLNIDERKHVLDHFNTLTNITFDNIFLTKNINYINSINAGIKFSREYNKPDYIGIIHNDIVVTNNWLKNLVLTLKSSSNIMVAVSLSYEELLLDDNKINEKYNIKVMDTFDKTYKEFNKSILAEKLIFEEYSNINLNDYLLISSKFKYFSSLFNPKIFDEIGYLNEDFNNGICSDIEYNFKIINTNNYTISKCFSSFVSHQSRSTFKNIFSDKIIDDLEIGNLEQFKISNSLNKNKNKKYVIYTCIIDGYDNLKVPDIINTEKFDYICFTNRQIFEKFPWKVIDISNICNTILTSDHVKFARYFKTHPHYFFKNYEKSIWIDANIVTLIDPINFLDQLKDGYLLTADHPQRNDIYEEINACNIAKKDTWEHLNQVQKFLISENYPAKITKLIQSNILLREHNNKECKFLMDRWWEMIFKYSRRDQLSFNYVIWKYGGKYMSIPWDIMSLKYFTTNYMHNK